MTQFTPAILKPTATLLVDDDSFFIENVRSLLPKDVLPSVFCAQELEKINNCSIFSASGKHIQNIKLNSFPSLKDLFKSGNEPLVSTIVIDQSMSPKNGLEILKNINNNFVQKILVSNFLKHEDALQALNEGLINAYLCKMEPNFIKNLTKSIYEAQSRFFYNLSLAIPNFLSNDNPLIEKGAQNIFKTIQDQYSVKYYEANDNLRNFSFYSFNNKEHVNLLIIPQEEVEEVLLSQQADSAPEEVIQLIRNGKMLPCFKNSSIPDGQEWIGYLRPAQTFQGSRKYIYAIYQDEHHESI